MTSIILSAMTGSQAIPAEVSLNGTMGREAVSSDSFSERYQQATEARETTTHQNSGDVKTEQTSETEPVQGPEDTSPETEAVATSTDETDSIEDESTDAEKGDIDPESVMVAVDTPQAQVTEPEVQVESIKTVDPMGGPVDTPEQADSAGSTPEIPVSESVVSESANPAVDLPVDPNLTPSTKTEPVQTLHADTPTLETPVSAEGAKVETTDKPVTRVDVPQVQSEGTSSVVETTEPVVNQSVKAEVTTVATTEVPAQVQVSDTETEQATNRVSMEIKKTDSPTESTTTPVVSDPEAAMPVDGTSSNQSGQLVQTLGEKEAGLDSLKVATASADKKADVDGVVSVVDGKVQGVDSSSEGTTAQIDPSVSAMQGIRGQTASVETPGAEQPEVVEPRRVMTDIVRGVRASIAGGVGRLRLSMDPPQLGKVTLNMIVRQGVGIRLEVETQTDQARRVIEANLDELRASLEKQGYTVVSIDVRQNGDGQSAGQSGRGRSQRRFQMDQLLGIESPISGTGTGLAGGAVLDGGRLNMIA